MWKFIGVAAFFAVNPYLESIEFPSMGFAFVNFMMGGVFFSLDLLFEQRKRACK